MIYATVLTVMTFASVVNPRRLFALVSAPPAPINNQGFVYDQNDGAFLYDDVTGLPITA